MVEALPVDIMGARAAVGISRAQQQVPLTPLLSFGPAITMSNALLFPQAQLANWLLMQVGSGQLPLESLDIIG